MAKAQSKTAKKSSPKAHARSNQHTSKNQPQKQQPNTFFLITMSFLAATLLIMNLVMLTA